MGLLVKIPAIGYPVREANRLILECEKMLLSFTYHDLSHWITPGFSFIEGAANLRSNASVTSRVESSNGTGEADLHLASVGRIKSD